MASRNDIIALLTMLEEVLPRKEKLSDGAINIYVASLKDVDIELLKASAQLHINTKTFYPSIAELREAALSLTTNVPTAIEAWGEVRKALSRGKSIENPIAAKVVEAMGYNYLGYSVNEMADRAHFIKAYEQVAEREERNQLMLPEITNLAKQLEAGK